MLQLIIFGTLALVGSAPMYAVLRPDATDDDAFDDVDRHWAQNTVIMPEIVPTAHPKRVRIKNTGGRWYHRRKTSI